MKFCSKCMTELTHNELLTLRIKEALGSSCNSGYGRAVWRKQIEHGYCTPCKKSYKKQQEEEFRKFNEIEKRFVLRMMLPLAVAVFSVLIYVFYLKR